MLVKFLLLAASAALASSFPFSGESAVLVLPANVTPAQGLALRDVQRDLYSVTGFVIAVLPSAPSRGSLPAGTTVIYLLTDADTPPTGVAATQCFTGAESHCVLAAADGGNGLQAIYASGSGARGAIYGWYSFSENVLGVNPLFLFTDDAPAYAPGPIAVDDALALTFAPPRFAVRSWFVNDEDLLAGSRQDPAGETVIDLVTYDQICETLLRLKGNAMIPSTNPFPDENNLRLVSRRGLIVMSHHYDLLGSNVFAWPLAQSDWDWEKNPATMSMVWRASVAAQVSLGGEVIWSVGLRGLNDYNYPCPSPAVCGRLISEAIGNQSQWVDEIAGPGQYKILYLWDELLDLLAGGDLTLPPDVHIIFTDSGAGFINIDKNATKYVHGVYTHTAMYNSVGNQLTEMVPADRIFAQFKNFLQYANSSDVVIDNLSDIRPALMTSEALMRMAWDPVPFCSGDTNASALAFYAAWGARQFRLSPADADKFATVWKDYFAVPLIQGGRADNLVANLISDNAIRAAGDVQKSGNVSGTTAADTAKAVADMGASTPTLLLAILARAQALAASGAVPAERLPFFGAHTLVGTATTAYSSQAVVDLGTAVASLAAGDKPSAAAALASAIAAMDALFALRRAAEYGPWRTFYLTDNLTDMQRARKALRALQVAVASSVGAPLPPVTPYTWYNFEVYKKAFAANYPLIRFNASWNLQTYVRCNCVFSQVDAGVCANSPVGGTFSAGAGAAVTLQIMMSQTAASTGELVIRYTLDGTTPTAASPSYEAGHPISLDSSAVGGTATIRALAFTSQGDAASPQITEATYTKR